VKSTGVTHEWTGAKQEHILQEAARQELEAGTYRQARVPDAQPRHRSRPRRRRPRSPKSGIPLGLCGRPPSDADLLSMDPGSASRHPGGQREGSPANQLSDRAGRRLRHRALRRRGQEGREARGDVYVGQTPVSSKCRPFVKSRRHRTLGQLHPEGRHRRHHPVDPRGNARSTASLYKLGPSCSMSSARAGIPASRPKAGSARRRARDLGRLPRQLEGSSSIRRRRLGGATFDCHGWRSLAPITHRHEHQGSIRRKGCSTSPATPPSRR